MIKLRSFSFGRVRKTIVFVFLSMVLVGGYITGLEREQIEYDCNIACWENIVPNKTQVSEVETLLRQSTLVNEESIAYSTTTDWFHFDFIGDVAKGTIGVTESTVSWIFIEFADATLLGEYSLSPTDEGIISIEPDLHITCYQSRIILPMRGIEINGFDCDTNRVNFDDVNKLMLMVDEDTPVYSLLHFEPISLEDYLSHELNLGSSENYDIWSGYLEYLIY